MELILLQICFYNMGFVELCGSPGVGVGDSFLSSLFAIITYCGKIYILLQISSKLLVCFAFSWNAWS